MKRFPALSKHITRALIGIATCSAALASEASPLPAVEPGAYEPTWKSFSQHQVPEWFRDAKFGVWSHWGPQSAAEDGDWYANGMYSEGSRQYKNHLNAYGHPSEFGFKDLIATWKGDKFDPDALAKLYRESGARYIVSMAVHHDNFDNWASTHQPWNSVNMGPRQDIVGLWKAAAEKQGMKFGVSVHNINTWGWYDPARGADRKGPLKGVRYDGLQTKADGKGKWWDGYDPADLYGPPHKGGGKGDKPTAAFMTNWFLRTKELIDKYQPDILNFDLASPIHKWRTWTLFEDITGTPEPDGRVGMLIGQHYYNSQRKWNKGRDGGVITLKLLPEERRKGATQAWEQTFSPGLMPEPWHKELSMGAWHYQRGEHFMGAHDVIATLIEVVSHNGNLLLNIVQKSDGSIAGDQEETLREVGRWLNENGEAIYATRPWKIAAEGPHRTQSDGTFKEQTKEGKLPDYTSEDIRFTQSKDGKNLYAIIMKAPADGKVTIQSLAEGSPHWPGPITSVNLANGTALEFSRKPSGLDVALPMDFPTKHPLSLKVN